MAATDDMSQSHHFLRARWAMHVLWPAFVMAGVLEALVFAVIDPGDLSWFGSQASILPRQAVYTLSFLIMWLVIALACGLTLLLTAIPDRHRRAIRATGRTELAQQWALFTKRCSPA